MATTTVPKAYVDEILVARESGKPWAIKTTELHYKKNGDKYEIKGRTFRTIRAGFGAEIDFSQYEVGDQIEVAGKEETEESESNGKKYYNLIIQAEYINLVKKGEPRPSAGDARMNIVMGLGAKEIDPNAPF